MFARKVKGRAPVSSVRRRVFFANSRLPAFGTNVGRRACVAGLGFAFAVAAAAPALSLAQSPSSPPSGQPAMPSSAPSPSPSATGAPLPIAGTTAPSVRAATLTCANDRLPPSILNGPPARAATPPLGTIDVRAPKASLHLALALDDQTREFGLMCVTHLHAHAGMLFAFARDDTWEFWMKRTLVSLDMVWLDATGRVTGIAANVPASTVSTADAAVARRSGHGRYVLELSAGEAKPDGLLLGTKLALPPLAPR
jgi:uncharacterized membrane protein (UPF0127 family)